MDADTGVGTDTTTTQTAAMRTTVAEAAKQTAIRVDGAMAEMIPGGAPADTMTGMIPAGVLNDETTLATGQTATIRDEGWTGADQQIGGIVVGEELRLEPIPLESLG